MQFYQTNFAVFAVINALLTYREYRQVEVVPFEKDARKLVQAHDHKAELKRFKRRFLPIYLLVNGADWLQVCLLPPFSGQLSLTRIGTLYLSIV